MSGSLFETQCSVLYILHRRHHGVILHGRQDHCSAECGYSYWRIWQTDRGAIHYSQTESDRQLAVEPCGVENIRRK